MDEEAITALISEAIPDVTAVYVFGSEAAGDATAESDVDLAVLGPAALDSYPRWRLQESLASRLRRDVDLVDLRAASSVMRAQIVATGRVLLDLDPAARAHFEALALSDYARLNEERKAILDDIRERGTIYG